jgi:3'(2'), 5'-bisphosphate nucleotidase
MKTVQTNNGLLNPDMPTQELRLHMGELTANEVLVARAAIRWANSYAEHHAIRSGEQAYAMKDVVGIAKKAGAAIMAELNAGIVVESKGDTSPVTAADRAADAIIKAGLRHLTPNIPIISEEDTAEEREAAERIMQANGGLRWVIDPLDGTKTAIDYARGHKDYDQFGVHIGLVQGNTPIAGVAYFPAMEHGKGVAYFTEDGKAYKQTGDSAPKQIKVSKPPLKAGELRAAVHFHESRRPEMIAGRHYHAVPGVGGQRLCLVAEGAADVADMNDISETHRGQYAYKQWDLAAAHAIVKAAGGELISAETQQPVTYDSPELKMEGACAGGREMLNLLQLATLPMRSSKAR